MINTPSRYKRSMSSIHNTQRCLLKAPGVTYERLLPICLTLFSCSSCHSVCMSAAAADRSLSFPPPPPRRRLLFAPRRHFGEPEKWLSRVRLLRYRKGRDPRDPLSRPPVTRTPYPLPLQRKTKTNLIMRLHISKRKYEALISMRCFDNHLST